MATIEAMSFSFNAEKSTEPCHSSVSTLGSTIVHEDHHG